MSTLKARRSCRSVFAASVLAGLATVSPVAAADTGLRMAPPPGSPSPSECLNDQSLPANSSVDAQINRLDNVEVTLECGGRNKYGVRHINRAHPIATDGSDDANLLQCMANILTRADNYWGESTNTRNHVVEIKRSDGGTATLVYSADLRGVVSMFTSGDSSNNWAACAA